MRRSVSSGKPPDRWGDLRITRLGYDMVDSFGNPFGRGLRCSYRLRSRIIRRHVRPMIRGRFRTGLGSGGCCRRSVRRGRFVRVYPLPTLFRGLLPGKWYGPSDVRSSQCPYRDLPFRRFRRPGSGGGVPDATTLGRFRSRLAGHDLWELLPGGADRQLEEQHIVMTGGRINIVDATPVGAARSGRDKRKGGAAARDPEAGPDVGKDGRGRMKGTYGHPIRTGVDGDGFVHRRTVVPGNVHDGREHDRRPSGDGTAFHADAAHGSRGTRDKPVPMGLVLRRTSRKCGSTAFVVRTCLRPSGAGYRKRAGSAAGQGRQDLADPAGRQAGHEAGKDDAVDPGARRAQLPGTAVGR